jgi:hypothetical protein
VIARLINVQNHSQVRQKGSAQNGREGQTVSLREVPQTKPATSEDARSVVLPGVS